MSSESALRGARASAALAGATSILADLRPAGLADDATVQGALRVTAASARWSPSGSRHRCRRSPACTCSPRPAPSLTSSSADPPARRRPSPGWERSPDLLAGGTQVPGTLLAAVVHGELATLAPFGGADGLVARAAERLTLITRGVDPKAVSVPEVGHLERAEDYRSALAGYATGSADGVAGWLRHCAAAVELGAREGLAICEAVLRG